MENDRSVLPEVIVEQRLESSEEQSHGHVQGKAFLVKEHKHKGPKVEKDLSSGRQRKDA